MSEIPRNDTDRDPWIGRVVDGRYRVLERIGHGGMGAVYKVVHTGMGKIAAMKLLHSSLASDSELLRRFKHEATAISKLSHPNIVQIFDFGHVGSSMYLVLEYLKGEDLGALLKRDGPLSFHRSAPLLMQVCDALAEAHELNIVHRDLKPENVRIYRAKDGQDFVKVLDFGLAKIVEEEQDAGITASGSLVGTPYYMSPELIRAQPLDGRCDIYSLGAMAYRMLTGENAFSARTPVGVLTKHLTEAVIPPSQRAPDRGLTREMDAIILRAMAKEPSERYQTALELKRDLIEVYGSSLPSAADGGAVTDACPSLVFAPRRRGADTPAGRQQVESIDLATGRFDDAVPTTTPVLAKEDFAFERRLHQGRPLKILLLLGLLAGTALAAYWFLLRQNDIYAPTREIEPNNSPDTATPLLPGRRISGHLGQRVSATESDRDWYRIKVEGDRPQVVFARVSGIPNMDITLELFDSLGGRVMASDSSDRGGDEVIANCSVGPGTYYLLVREVWQVEVPPTENVTDEYHLEARWTPLVAGWEVEPNDRPEQASSLTAGESLGGYLSPISDVDYVRLKGAEGFLSGEVSAIPGVDVAVEIHTAGRSRPRIIDKSGLGLGEQFSRVRMRGDQELLLKIRRKSKSKSLPGETAAGLDVSYKLRTWLTPAH